MTSLVRPLLLVVAFALAFPSFGATEAPLAPGMVHPGYEEQPAWFKNSFLDLREDLAEAAAHGKRVLLYFYQDGCPYCKRLLQDNFGQRPIADKTRRYFDVVAINMWGDREVIDLEGKSVTEKEFARQMKIMFTPTLVALDEKGDQALRINGYYAPHQFEVALDYAGQRREVETPFKEYLARNAPVASEGRLHHDRHYLGAPYRLDLALKTSRKPLLVLFEQKQCRACDELHLDILQRKPSRELLGRFQVAQFDQWAATRLTTPDGRQISVREWAKELNVVYAPTLVFFDASGHEVFRTEAYLKAFHLQSALDYVASGAYRQYSGFQRYIEARAHTLRARGVTVDIMN